MSSVFSAGKLRPSRRQTHLGLGALYEPERLALGPRAVPIAEIAVYLPPVGRVSHLSSSDRLAWMPWATSGLFMVKTWMWFTPLAMRSIIWPVA